MKTLFRDYRVTYCFTNPEGEKSHSELTVNSNSVENAIIKAKQDIQGCYGTELSECFEITNVMRKY